MGVGVGVVGRGMEVVINNTTMAILSFKRVERPTAVLVVVLFKMFSANENCTEFNQDF